MNMLRMAVFCMTICWAGAAEWQFPEVGEQKVFFAAFRESVIGSGPQARVNPALTFDQEEKKDGYVQYTVSYAVDHDERISAYLLVPEHESGQKMPLMFCLHPTSRGGKDMVVGRHATAPADKAERKKWENRAYALELVKRGFVCFVPDRGGFGERSPLPDEPDPFRNMRVYQERLAKKYPNWSYPMGKVPWDLSCALDALLSLDFIDPARIGTVGHSLGGWDSLYFWGSDPRVKAAVINSGGAHQIIPDAWTNQAWRLAFARGKARVSANTNRSAQVFMMMGAPRPLLYMRSMRDSGTDYPSSVMENLRMIRAYYCRFSPNEYEIGGKPQFSAFFHNEGHDFPPFARELAWRWLELQLQGKE